MRLRTLPFLEVLEDVSGGNKKVPKAKYQEAGDIPVIDQGKGFIGGYTDDETCLFKSAELPVVIFGDHTRCLKYADEPFAMGADGVKVLKAVGGQHERYIYHYLRQAKIPDAGYDRHFKYLKRLTIPLPPVAEQKRIAAVLDQADALLDQRRQGIAKLDELLQAVFLDMFGDPVTNPKDWPTARLSDIGRIVTGNTPSRRVSRYYGDAVEWIKSDNLNNDSHYLTQAEEHLSKEGAKVARLAPVGSILVTCIAGTPDCIGNLGIANRQVSFNQQINALVPKRVDQSLFLYALLKHSKKLIQGASTNSMKGMVSKSSFSSISVISPPDSLRRDFAEKFRGVETLRARQVKQQEGLDVLFASLQQRAFRGEL